MGTVKTPIITGSKVKSVRIMTSEELKEEYWNSHRFGIEPIIIEFDNGVKIYASRDSEGNGAGVMFGKYKETSFYITEEKL